MKKTVCVVLFIVLLLSACGSDNSKDKTNNVINGQTEGSITQNGTGTTTEDPGKAYIKKGYIIADHVNIRSGPTLSSEIVDVLGISDRVDIVGRGDAREKIGEYEDYWYNVKYLDIDGWCFGEYVSSLDELDEKLVSRFGNFTLTDGICIDDAVSVLSRFTRLTNNREVVDECVRKITQLQNKREPKYRQELWELIDNYQHFLSAWNNPETNNSELNKKLKRPGNC